MLSILDKFRESIVSQGPDIDERLLRTMKSCMGGIIEFQNAVDTLRKTRVSQGTFSQHSQLTWGFCSELYRFLVNSMTILYLFLIYLS